MFIEFYNLYNHIFDSYTNRVELDEEVVEEMNRGTVKRYLIKSDRVISLSKIDMQYLSSLKYTKEKNEILNLKTQ